MQDLLNLLDEIFETLGASEKLAAPIADQELAHLAENLPFKIPSNLESLYRWHNGVEQFIPAYDLLDFENAVAQYEGLVAFAEDMKDEDFFKSTHFPILQHQDSYFVIDCAPNSGSNIYYVFVEGGNTYKEYESLEQMLQIVVDAYLSRAYYIEDELLWDNPILLQRIKNKYLSQEQRAQREANWANLSGEASRLLRSRDGNRKYFIRMLYEFYDERAIGYLLEFLNDSDPEVIASAAFGLGELKAREGLPELLKLLKHPVEIVRNLSAHAIAEIVSFGDELLLQPLLNLLSDKEALVRIHAVEVLGQLRSPKAVLPLIGLLRDRNTGVRYHVIEALGKIRDPRAIEALQRRKSEVRSGQEIQLIDQAICRIEKVNS